MPETVGSETAKEVSKIDRGTGKREAVYKRWRLRDLAAAYKDLTADMDLMRAQEEDKYKRARELLGGVPDALDG